MPPPKRPFTTSSLTSSLKATFANQPLLNNLTNIDKLSSQASSLAQKTPFFGAINQQFQQHHHQQQQQQQESQNQQDAGQARPAQNQPDVTSGAVGNSSNSSGSGSGNNPQSGPSRTNTDMFRNVQTANQGLAPAPQVPAVANTPVVDMSHLTEEERAMIQSVMAKAEMADMGLPIDTSMPSSTNLPSNTSQALTQQRDQQQKQQQMEQHRKQQMHNGSAAPSDLNQHQQPNSSQQNQQHLNQSQPIQQQQSMQDKHEFDIKNQYQQQAEMVGQMGQSFQQKDSTMDMVQRQLLQQQQQRVNQSQPTEIANQSNFFAQQLVANQTDIDTESSANQAANNYYRQDINNNMIVNNEDLGYREKIKQQAQTLDQQSIMQAGIMNLTSSSFEFSTQTNQNSSLNLQQQQQQQNQQQRFINNDTNQATQDHMMTQYSPNSAQIAAINNAQQLTSVPLIQGQYNFQDSFPQAQQLAQSQVQIQLQPTPQTQINQVTGLAGNYEHIQSLPNSVNHLNQSFELGNLSLNATNFMNNSNLDEQLSGGNVMAQYRVDTNSFVQNPLFEPSGQQAMKPLIVQPRVRPRSNMEAISDFEHEHAFSDLDDQRAATRKRGARSNQPVSRHESVETDRRSSKRSRDRGLTRDMQAYDLANQRLESRMEQKSRRLPQPGCSNQIKSSSKDRSLPSSSEYLPEYRQKSREDKVHQRRIDVPPKPTLARPKSAIRRGTRSSHYQTETDLDYDSQSGTDSAEPGTRPNEVVVTKKVLLAKETEEKEKTENQGNSRDDDENEEALALLKTLKLTEHANQVMQQQQLLIKQSQELIKLQQAQLEQQTEVKKNSGDKQARSQSGEEDALETIVERKLSTDKRSDDEILSTIRSPTGENANGSERSNAKKVSSSKGAKEALNSSKVKREEFEMDESTKTNHEILSELDQTKNLDKSSSSRLLQNHSNQSSRLSTNHRRERDIVLSPTDTTDSDAELVSRSSSRLRQQKQSSRPVTAQKVRREPQGLPPSPLPVAAAIQLHQMQQKHKNQLVTSNISRANYLRSRSVTSSPNHMLDRLGGSGYMTDDQRRRPTSPDTLSEYGGLRRRKRLPNPPQNVLPITPSVVRRMNQVNRMNTSGPAITAANPRSTIASSNISSRLVKNTNFNPRFPSSSVSQIASCHHRPNFDRVNLPHGTRSTSNSVLPGSNISNKYHVGSSHQTTSANPLTLARGFDSLSAEGDLTKSNLRSQPKSSLNYYDSSIGAEINDIKETPELDKLISNFDAYYNLESAPDSKFNQQQYTSATKPMTSALSRSDNSHLAPITRSSDTRPSTSIYGLPRDFQAQPYSNLSSTTDTAYMGFNRSRMGVDDYSSAYPSMHPGHEYTSNQNYTPTSNYPTSSCYVASTSSPLSSRQHNLGSHQFGDSDALSANRHYPSLRTANYTWQSIDQPNYARDPYVQNLNSPSHMTTSRRYSYDSATNDLNYNMRAPAHELIEPTEAGYNRTAYTDNTQRKYGPEFRNLSRQANYRENVLSHQSVDQFGSNTNSVTPLTKADIINNGPKFDSIGYRFRTESLNKYVTDQRTPVECLQSKYLYPYKRILLSKNPKDRIGNGIGVKIVGGHPLPNLYDKVNKCIVTSGAFVTEVFQSSRVYFMDEMHEGDQIIEWNGVNLCNRSDEEVQQILYSQFSDDEVEIIYLNRDKFSEAYDVGHERVHLYTTDGQRGRSYDMNDAFDVFSRLNRTSVGNKKSRTLGLD